jgi:hypothetical protein
MSCDISVVVLFVSSSPDTVDRLGKCRLQEVEGKNILWMLVPMHAVIRYEF